MHVNVAETGCGEVAYQSELISSFGSVGWPQFLKHLLMYSFLSFLFG